MATLTNDELQYMNRAIELSRSGAQQGKGGPFGCVIVKNGEIVGEGYNLVIQNNDPTAHAEIVAIRAACKHLDSFQLEDCDVYTSCEPCPMCLGAIYWARPRKVIYANTRSDAASINFDDDFIYGQLHTEMKDRQIPFEHFPLPEALQVFQEWKNMEGKTLY